MFAFGAVFSVAAVFIDTQLGNTNPTQAAPTTRRSSTPPLCSRSPCSSRGAGFNDEARSAADFSPDIRLIDVPTPYGLER